MSHRKTICIMAGGLVFIFQILFSQIIVQGTVTDNGAEYLGNGAEPVAGVLVTLVDEADANRTFSAYTDDQGYYSIEINGTGIDDDPYKGPGEFRLMQNYPNPFNPSTVIAYKLSKPRRISLQIYDVLGRRVRTLFEGIAAASGEVIWNGTDDMGRGVPAGVYIYCLQSGGRKINKKMLLLDGEYRGGFSAGLSVSTTLQPDDNPIGKHLSDEYTLRVTGQDIADYREQNLYITSSTTIDVTVSRTLTDFDGNVYTTVKIGDQWWMAENLKVTHYSNGDEIPNVTDNSQWEVLLSGAYRAHTDNNSNVQTYGYLYNWFCIDGGIAPEGWHVPTDAEWRELEVFLGMSTSDADNVDWRGTDQGDKLREAGTVHWLYPNTTATNESGFCALPGGICYPSGSFHVGIGETASFWSSSYVSMCDAWARFLQHENSGVCRWNDDKRNGFSIRCVRD